MEQLISIKLGFSTKLILLLLAINYIGQFFKAYFYFIFSNIPLFTVLKLEIWRLITGFFTSCSLFEYVFNSFIVLTIFNHWENKEGTSKYLIILFSNVIIFQVTMLILYLILIWLFPIILSFSIKSLPSLGIAFLVKYMLLTDSKTIIVYPKIRINDRLLIVAYLIGFILLFGFELRIELIISFYYGFLMCKYDKFFGVEMINEDKINAFESNDKHKALFKLDGWVLYDERYIVQSKEVSTGMSIENINNNHLDSVCNDNENIHQNNKIEIVEDKQEGNDNDNAKSIAKDSNTAIENDFVDLSLEDIDN